MVSSHFLTMMLSGKLPLALKQVNVVGINFRPRVDGWLLDDLLVNVEASENIDHESTISLRPVVKTSRSEGR